MHHSIQIIKFWGNYAINKTQHHIVRITSLSLLPNGDLISLSHDNTIHIWDGKTLTSTKTKTIKVDSIKSMIILSDGAITTSCANGVIKFWDTRDFKCFKAISLPKKYHLGKLFTFK
jgi:WD40 repeat protein